MTGPPTVPGRDLNPGPLSFEASALLTELTRPDKSQILLYLSLWLLYSHKWINSLALVDLSRISSLIPYWVGKLSSKS